MNENDELEPEILSYREFQNRETLLAWQRRRRAIESQFPTARFRRRVPPVAIAQSSGHCKQQEHGAQ
jgi:hypothetical protein